MKPSLFTLASVAAMLLLTGVGMAPDLPAEAGDTVAKPGEGVLCLWALTSVASEISRRCPVKSDPEIQAALDESVAQIERYVANNGKWPSENIERFKRQEGGSGLDAANLCTPDGLQLYQHLRSQGTAALRADVNKAIARPGTPAWGDCL